MIVFPADFICCFVILQISLLFYGYQYYYCHTYQHCFKTITVILQNNSYTFAPHYIITIIIVFNHFDAIDTFVNI